MKFSCGAVNQAVVLNSENSGISKFPVAKLESRIGLGVWFKCWMHFVEVLPKLYRS